MSWIATIAYLLRVVKILMLVLLWSVLKAALLAILPHLIFGLVIFIAGSLILSPILAPLLRPIGGLFKLFEQLFALAVGVRYLKSTGKPRP